MRIAIALALVLMSTHTVSAQDASAARVIDLRGGAEPGVRVTVRHNAGGRIYVAIDLESGGHGACFTPCVVLASAGAMHVQSGHMGRTIDVAAGHDVDVEVDPGWDDHARGLVAGWYALVLAGLAVDVVALVAYLTNADQVCSPTSAGGAIVTVCNHSWAQYGLLGGTSIGLVGVILNLIATFGGAEGGVRTRGGGAGSWVSVALAPTFDAAGAVRGAWGGMSLRF